MAWSLFTLIFNLTLLSPLSAVANSTLIVEETLMENHPSVMAIERDDANTLYLWLRSGHTPLAKIKNKLNERLIDRAAAQGSYRCFELILKSVHFQKGDSELKDSRGTPLLVSLSSMAMPGRAKTPIYERMIALVITMLPDLVQSQDHAYVGDGRTALHQAAAVGNVKVMEMLISNRAQINAKNTSGETPLHFAARFNHIDAVKYLVASGALINEKTRYTRATPLMSAAEMGNEKVIRLLMLSGAERDARDVFGKTAPERFREFRVASSSALPAKK